MNDGPFRNKSWIILTVIEWFQSTKDDKRKIQFLTFAPRHRHCRFSTQKLFNLTPTKPCKPADAKSKSEISTKLNDYRLFSDFGWFRHFLRPILSNNHWMPDQTKCFFKQKNKTCGTIAWVFFHRFKKELKKQILKIDRRKKNWWHFGPLDTL